MFYFLSFFWFLREVRTLFFWIYLWQLKEYHWGRFIDHFRTEKGKKLFWNPVFVIKILLLFYASFLGLSKLLLPWHFYVNWIFILSFIYFLESLKGLKEIFQDTLKRPVLTQKTSVLISLLLAVNFLFLYILFQTFYFVSFQNLYWFAFYFLIFDISAPVITTIVVFLIHPLSVIFFRNPLIKKAKKKREKMKNLLVIGITGSFGKTSTKDFLAAILSEKFKVLKTKEHQNSEVGISSCILNELKENHEIFVVEMGAYNKGGIKFLSDIVKPKIGIVTGINEQHLATFGSMENLLSAEGGKELIDSLPEDGVVFLNGRNKYCLGLYEKTKIKKKLYGENIKLAGLENIEGAKLVAEEFGMTEEEIKKSLEKIENQFPGIEIKKNKAGLNIIQATYSANPDGVISHLDYLKTFSGRKIIVMPCLIELGNASGEVHCKIGEKISEVCDLAIITTKDKFNEIQEKTGNKAIFMDDPKEIFEKIKNFLKEEDNLLLEGRVPRRLMNLLGIG